MISVKFLKFQEFGVVNEAFEYAPEQRERYNKFVAFYGVRTVTSTDEKRNVVFIVIIH